MSHMNVVGDRPDGSRIFAIIPAAGRSIRMGRCKALLPLGNETVIERLCGIYEALGIRTMVVTGTDQPSCLAQLIDWLGAGRTPNRFMDEGLLGSVRSALSAVPHDFDAFVVHPVDVPAVSLKTIESLVCGFDGSAPVFALSLRMRRGHPVLFRADLAPPLVDYDGPGGLRGFQAPFLEATHWVHTDDEGVLVDMDTPEQYAQVLSRLLPGPVPSAEDCLALWDEFDLASGLRRHCTAVRDAAKEILRHYRLPGLDTDLVLNSALLHDIAKGHKFHDRAGACLVRRRGWHSSAACIRSHMDLPPVCGDQGSRRLTERSLLFLADKITSGGHIVGLGKSFRASAARLADRSALPALARRLRSAVETAEILVSQCTETSSVCRLLGLDDGRSFLDELVSAGVQ